jgi:hypothetical protein
LPKGIYIKNGKKIIKLGIKQQKPEGYEEK